MASDTKFFQMMNEIKAELKGLKGEGLEVADFAFGPLLDTPILDATFWIVLSGAQESFCEELNLRCQRHVDRFSREGLVLRVGFESYSRVQESGPFSYFR